MKKKVPSSGEHLCCHCDLSQFLLYCVMLTQWEQCHKGNECGTNSQASPSQRQQSYHKIRHLHVSCLMEKTNLCRYHCPPFLSDLRLLYTNTVVEWVYTYTYVNVSHCWICSEFPVSPFCRTARCAHAADVRVWEWLTPWGPQLLDWTVIHTWVDTQRRT